MTFDLICLLFSIAYTFIHHEDIDDISKVKCAITADLF